MDPLTQLRWQSLTKAEADAGATPAPAPAASAAADDAGLPDAPRAIPEQDHSESGSQLRYWHDKISEARDVLESARTARRRDCPAVPPGEKLEPDDERYCDRLRREEQAASTRYESLRRDATRAGFPTQ